MSSNNSTTPSSELTAGREPDPHAGNDEVDLADYGRARDEIDNRTELSAQLMNYELALVAAVIASYDKIPHEASAVAACVSSLFWLMWIDHTSQIYKLAAYIELVLAHRVRQRHPGALGWERFLRDLDAGGAKAAAVLYGNAAGRDIRVPATSGIGRYISLLFGGSSIVLLTLFISEFGSRMLRAARSGQGAALAEIELLRIGLALAAGALFVYAIIKNAQLRALMRAVSDAVRAAAH